MSSEKFEFSGYQGAKLPAVLWLPEGEPKAVLQITHGMTEHIGRYEAFAQQMTARGVAVAGFDLRGHGKNPGNPLVASFGEGGWEASLADMRLFFDCLQARFPHAPHYMLGFSLGSFLLREYLARHPENIAGAVIMGTGHQPSAVLTLIMAIIKGQIRKGGFDQTTPLVRQLSFGTYNQQFKPARTPSDWLCADEKQLDQYLADPLCRKDISAGLFWQLLASMKRSGSKDACTHYNKAMPVLLLSGQSDPVGGMGKGVQAVHRQLAQAGMKRLSLQLLPGARHMVLCENACGASDKAQQLIADWLNV